jgi:hypothetical protein
MVLRDIAKTRSSQQESTYSYASQIARKVRRAIREARLSADS